jgi:hypothetical protein
MIVNRRTNAAFIVAYRQLRGLWADHVICGGMHMNIRGVAVALALAFAPAAAGAVTVSVLNHSPNSGTGADGNKAHLYAANYNGTTPMGASWGEGAAAPLVVPPPSDEAGVYKSPFSPDGLAETQTYFSVGGQDDDGEGSLLPRTLNFDVDQDGFTLLWGSIDSYNTITFLSGGSNVFVLNGTQLADKIGGLSANFWGNYDHTALVEFAFGDETFDTVLFDSDRAAFEFALPVPLPAGALLIGTAFLGAGAVRRWGRRQG